MLKILTSLTAVLWLTFILSQAAYAEKTSPQCEVFISDKALLPTEIQTALTENGYSVKKIDTAGMDDNTDFAELLRSSRDIVLKAMPNNRMAFYMAAQVPTSRDKWNPLKNIMSYKEFLAQPSKYSCENIQRNLHLINLTRSAVAQGLRYVFPNPSMKAANLNWGHFFLTLEYNLAVRSGRSFDIAAANKKYDQLLRRIEGLKLDTGLNFFSRWKEVKELLFSNNQENLDYCRDKTFLADALLNHCTNCIGYTTLLSALTKDAGIAGPAGWQLGIESYSDHIRPVLFNSKKNQTFDLSTGVFDPANAPIYQMDDLIVLALRNQNSSLFPKERRLLQKVSPHSLYQPWLAHPQISVGAKKQSSIYDFSALASAGRFSPQDPPAHADYSHLAEFATMEKAPQRPGRFWSGVSAMWTGLFHREDQRLIPGRFDSHQEKILYGILPDLVPSEKKVVLEALRQHRVTPAFIETFQYKKVFEILKIETDSWKNSYPKGSFVERRGLSLPSGVPMVARTSDSICTSLSVQPGQKWMFKTKAQQERYREMTTAQRYADLVRLIQTDIDRLGNHINATQVRWSLDGLLNESANNITDAHLCIRGVFEEIRSVRDFLGQRLGLVDNPSADMGKYFPLKFILAKEPARVVLDDIGALFENLTTYRHRLLKVWNGKALENRRSLFSMLTELTKDYRDYKIFLGDRHKKDDPANKLIMSVLLDPDFFYTTVPSQSELNAEQWKPRRQITAREKRRLEQKVRGLLSPTESIHPPVFDGFRCQPGQRYAGGQGQGLQVVVDCSASEAKGALGNSSKNIEGDIRGREGADGADNSDRRGQNPETSPDDSESIGYEYRQEIDLHPDVLHSLLSSASWYFYANPLARLMIHYLWRESLPTTDKDYFSSLKFFPADFKNTVLRVDLPVFKQKMLTPCRLENHFEFDATNSQCLLQQFRELIARYPIPQHATVPTYVRQGPPFVRLALAELTEHPKKIAVILPARPTERNLQVYQRGNNVGDNYLIVHNDTQGLGESIHRGLGIIHPEIVFSVDSPVGLQPVTANAADTLQYNDAYNLWRFLNSPH